MNDNPARKLTLEEKADGESGIETFPHPKGKVANKKWMGEQRATKGIKDVRK